MKQYKLKNDLVLISILLIAIMLIFLFPVHSHAAEKAVWDVLKDYQVPNTLGAKVYGIWNTLIKMTNGFVVVILIAVAFAQILRLNINTYGVKKILPTLVLAIIAANFSFLFCRLLVDFSSVIISIFLQGTDGTKTNATEVVGALSNISKNLQTLSGGPCPSATATNCYTFGTLFWHGIANLMLFAAGVIVLILAYLFVIRNWMIYFLVSLAPLAIMSLVLPQTKSLFNQWWTNFSKWVFMPVISVFWIWVASQWFSMIGSQGTFMSFIFAGVCFYLAITTPFKMGDKVMGAWGKIGKTAWGQTGGRATAFAKREAKERGVDAGLRSLGWMQRGNRVGRYFDDRLGQRVRNIKQRNVSARQERLLRAEGPGLVRKKMEDDAKIDAAGRLADNPRTNPLAISRYRALQRNWTLEETKSSEYQNADLQQLLGMAKFNPDGTYTTPWNDPSHQLHADYTNREGYGRQMAILEQMRRTRRSSRNPAERAEAELALNSIAITSRTPLTPAQLAAGQLNLVDPIGLDVHGYGVSAVGTPGGGANQGGPARPSIAGFADELRATAGDKADLILERAFSAENAKMGDADIGDIVKDMPVETRNKISKQLQEMGDTIEEQMESTGGNDSIENLKSGLFRIKSLMDKLGTGDFTAIEGAIKSNLGELDKYKDNPLKTMEVGDRKSLEHALAALNSLKANGRTSLPVESFGAVESSMVSGEIEKQRGAIYQGNNLGQGTVQSLASVGANVPLENLSLDTALAHLNQNIEHLSETTHDIANSSASPMGEMRGTGIGAIADRQAFTDLLKSSQSGLKDDLKGAMQGVFSSGYTGKDSLSNPAVAKIFAQEISTRLSQRLSKTPLTTQVTNMPKTVNAPNQATTSSAPPTTHPPVQTMPPPPTMPPNK